MTRVWVCRRSRRGPNAMRRPGPSSCDHDARASAQTKRSREVSKAEPLAEVEAAHILMRHDLVRPALHQHLAVVHNVGAIDDAQCLAHIMVCDQHANSTILEMRHKITDLVHGDRIDACEWL